MRMPPAPPTGPKLNVAMLVYPGMILLDLVGPQTILNILGSNIHLVAPTKDPVSTDVGIPVTPTTTFAECPANLDVLFVPGGLMGSIASMRDDATLTFLADRGSRAKYVTSVCTGGLVLGAAGLLRGYRATAHWGVVDLLPILGAIPFHERVVHDRNRLTGGGVTAGLDFGLTLAALLRGVPAAEHVQLIIEYSPHPPFHAGTPSEISPSQLASERRARVYMDDDARAAAMAAAKRLGLG
jgi:cyclohexyl-isocyanide hydratase